ncbi:flagellar hook-length control protein FliK [Litoreibacter halocynthiae]|uniref:Flagellar hook-length control protein FliK n=2 Tax=Litoreibacter halocynthiae TaxID=1242689 RepID=A0A4R7LE02_9RHOB|nr:flagellar hook-length control protein FliK [Litoreibacter halocynthiae]
MSGCETTVPQDHQADFGTTLTKLNNCNHVETLPELLVNDTLPRDVQLNPSATTQPQYQEKTDTEAALIEKLIEFQSTPLEQQLRSTLPILEPTEADALGANTQNTKANDKNTLEAPKTLEPSGLPIDQLSTEGLTAPHTMSTASNTPIGDPPESKGSSSTNPARLEDNSYAGVPLRVAHKGNSELEAADDQPKPLESSDASTNNSSFNLTEFPADSVSDVFDHDLSPFKSVEKSTIPTEGLELATSGLASSRSALESWAITDVSRPPAVIISSTLAPILQTLEMEAASIKSATQSITDSAQEITTTGTFPSGNLGLTVSRPSGRMGAERDTPAPDTSEFEAIDAQGIGSTNTAATTVPSQILIPAKSTVQTPPVAQQVEGDHTTSVPAPPSIIAASGTIHSASPNSPTPLPNHISTQICQALEGGGSQDVEIRLDPEELGRVRIVLSTKEGTMNITVFTERPEVLDLMRRNSDLLASDFSDIGYEGANFSFQEEQHERDQPTDSAREHCDTGMTTDAPESHQPQAIDGSARLDLKF